MRGLVLAGLLAGAAQIGCGTGLTSNVPLGRVVVYRNGVAYYERMARLDGDTLELTVPADKVDDFLKSLTVTDGRGKSLPVSFPSQRAIGNGWVVMSVQLPHEVGNDLKLTYMIEAPAWKPGYRIVVGDEGEVELQGWAIVDNTSGEDWNDVVVGVGSSSALSFRYDLWSIRDVQRDTLQTSEGFAKAPPLGQSTYRDDDGRAEVVLGELGDEELSRSGAIADTGAGAVAGRAVAGDSTAVESVVVTSARSLPVPPRASGPSYDFAGDRGEDKPAEPPALSPADRQREKLGRLAETIVRTRQRVVIEGYADTGEADPNARSLERANALRNQLIDNGVPPAHVEVRAGGVRDGRGAGVRVVAQHEEVQQGPPGADLGPVGESHFESAVPLTVPRETSVMVSIVRDRTEGKVVYLYDPESPRGDQRFAFRAVRLINPTGSTLEAGPVTVYGKARFIGEGLTEAIPPGAVAVVPFALDRQIIVEATGGTRDEIAQLVALARGVLTTEVKHIRKQELKVTNRLQKPATVYLRHTVQPGWNLISAPEQRERIGRAHLFAVELAAGETRTVSIEEETPLTRSLDLREPDALSLVEVYLARPDEHPEFHSRMTELLALHRAAADHEMALDSLRTRVSEYRTRMDELHAQIVTLKAVKSGGPLMRHLQEKLDDISDRVHKATIDIVDREEQLLLTRMQFQNAVTELTLAPKKPGKDVDERARAAAAR